MANLRIRPRLFAPSPFLQSEHPEPDSLLESLISMCELQDVCSTTTRSLLSHCLGHYPRIRLVYERCIDIVLRGGVDL